MGVYGVYTVFTYEDEYTVFTYEGEYTVFTVFTYEGVYTVFTIVFVFTHEGHSYATDTPIHAKNIGEEHSAKNVPTKNMTPRNVRNPVLCRERAHTTVSSVSSMSASLNIRRIGCTSTVS